MAVFQDLTAEIEKIQEEMIRSFVVDVLVELPEFYEHTTFVEDAKLTVKYATTICEALDAGDEVRDIILSASILQDITRFQLIDEEIVEDINHPLTVRTWSHYLVDGISAEKSNDIYTVIESSHGLNSTIPQVIPSVTDPVYLWVLPIANELVLEHKRND